MSLLKSLNSGVSGLKAFQTKMDTIGHNIANVETAGFKSSRVSFAEMMSERLGRPGGGGSAPQLSNQVGLGVRVASIDRDFSQGSMNSTGRATDLAIEGEGFFMVSNGGENLMTRAGNFVFNKDGFLVDQGGRSVQGYNADRNGNILGGGAAEDIRVDFENVLPPKKTDMVNVAGNLNASTSKSQILQMQNGFTASGSPAESTTLLNDITGISGVAATDTISFDIDYTDGSGNLQTTNIPNVPIGNDLGELVANIEAAIDGSAAGDAVDLSLLDGVIVANNNSLGDNNFDIKNINYGGTGTFSMPGFQTTQAGQFATQTMSTTVYDDLGKAHSLLVEFTQTNENEWSYEASFLDGESITSAGSNPPSVTFDETGQLTSANTLDFTYEPGGGAATTSFSIQLGDSESGTRLTQYSGSNSAKIVGQDGYTQGQLIDVAVDGSGQVQGVYDNGENQVLAQLALGTVQNQNGLEMMGGGLFRATSAAGEMFINTADNMSNTSINSGSLEGSNVDLAKEFTDMITSQRAYQSSARVISTSDEMLTEAVNLKR
ncbi:flagellar hook protein FlgE [Gracilimonas mengyeensis]|uniref:Flagellar hook protein FlgE n=1 Tax=Gracilimonas mengyeensis TaxID=1302730 RepID=A0A521ECP5_9BACT|nr:flagellar hook protein FlgE [Gracilimonas mengyeensis]SMO81582.1 flagellar hook protein FlgE [Gracilimonas mengyeensis]